MSYDPLIGGLLASGPVKPTNKSDNFVPGSGLVVLRKLLYGDPPAFEKRTFVAEWQVITSEPSGDVDGQGNLIRPNQPGNIVGYVQHPIPGTLAGKAAPGNIMMVVCALGGLTEDEANTIVEVDTPAGKEKRLQWAELLAQLKDPKTQPGKGIVCRYYARLTPTRDDKAKGLPKHLWHTFAKFEAVEQSPEQVEKFAKMIDEGKKITLADFETAQA